MSAPGTPNPGSSPVAALYTGLRLDVLGLSSGVSLTSNTNGPAFTVPRGARGAVLVSVIIDGFTVAQIDSGITLSFGYISPFTQLFSATFGAIIGKGVSAVTVTAGGSGYTTAPVTFTASDLGRGAAAHAVLSGDAVGSIVVDSPGDGYTVAPTVNIGGDGTLATATAVIGTATVSPSQPIIVLVPPKLARLAAGLSVSWAITNSVAANGTCNLTWLGGLL